jgi:phosphate transport system substrate-binding protein
MLSRRRRGGGLATNAPTHKGETPQMKKALTLTVALVGVIVIAFVAGRAQASPAKQTAGSLVGTGATFPFPLISKWIPAVDNSLGIKITYSPTGSGAGIAQVTARTVDFGASDAPLSADQLRACNGCVVIPWALAGLSVPYNVPGLEGRLRLSGPVLANIYLGTITNWNSPAIKALNPKLNLPDLKITPVYRSDGSGSTYAFTDYLSAVSPQFKSRIGFNTSVNFPAGTGARGSSGVTGVVKSTAGALTYVDAAYSLQNKIPFALIRNRAGTFTTPGIRGITQAVSQVPKKVTNLSQLKIVDPPKSAGKLAYPISTFTYVIIPTKSGDKAADLRRFIYWAVTQGQRFGPPLYFVPLPAQVQGFAYREIKKIQSQGT